MTLLFVQATNADILSIRPQAQQAEPSVLSAGTELFNSNVVALEGLAISVREDKDCIGAYGLVQVWPGVARVWALFSQRLIEEHPLALARRTKQHLQYAEETFTVHRIEATVAADFDRGINFLWWLGFTREGLMRRCSPDGTDMWLYARVKDVT